MHKLKQENGIYICLFRKTDFKAYFKYSMEYNEKGCNIAIIKEADFFGEKA